MQIIRKKSLGLRRCIVAITTFVLVAGYPAVGIASAQEGTSQPSAESQTTTPPPTPAPTPQPVQPTYTFNKATGHWDSDEWRYNPATGAYEKPPAPTIIEPKPVDTSSTTPTSSSATTATDTTKAQVQNEVSSSAASGDAAVSHNGTAGSAASGDANAQATIVNMVNSSIGTDQNAKVVTFTKDVLGDVKGDIVLDPLILKAMLEAKAPDGAKNTVTANTDLSAQNNVNVQAKSGNATVADNTSAGNATTGAAHAVANVVNILNSMIATQQSFIGTINIYGNLEGDILVAPDFIPQMIASNGGKSGSTAVSTKDTQSIMNTISAVADSGAASVFGNTKAGNATTGNASSNIVLFNLSGHDVIAKNSLLVFVNVLGKWVGVIVDAPQGATAAMLSNGVTQNSYTPDLTVDATSTSGIANTITVSAQSGDATVAHNTSAGNAVSGSATAMANVANISGSQFSASDWFGILFINVYQNWYGSFGLRTPYGDTPTSSSKPHSAAPIEFHPTSAQTVRPASIHYIDSRQVLASAVPALQANDTPQPSSAGAPKAQPKVLGLQAVKSTPDSQYDFRFLIILGSVAVIGLSAIGLKRLLS